MALPKDLDPYTSPRAFYGAELRRLREHAALAGRYQRAYDPARATALSPERTLGLIQSLARTTQAMSISAGHDLSSAVWRTSSYSNGDGGACVEVADGYATCVPVRDSKVQQGPVVVFPADAWRSFLGALSEA